VSHFTEKGNLTVNNGFFAGVNAVIVMDKEDIHVGRRQGE
jgi:hypothetical protein